MKANGNSDSDVVDAALDLSQDIAGKALAKVTRSPDHTITVTDRERDTILAALRIWQAWIDGPCSQRGAVSVSPWLGDALMDIADNGRDPDARLKSHHLDNLCTRFGGA